MWLRKHLVQVTLVYSLIVFVHVSFCYPVSSIEFSRFFLVWLALLRFALLEEDEEDKKVEVGWEKHIAP